MVIGHHSVVGKHASIHQGVTIGGKGIGGQFPVIGDRVYLSTGSKIIGAVRIGDDAVIGANAVVTKNVPDSAFVVGIPARVISFKGSKKFIHYREGFERP